MTDKLSLSLNISVHFRDNGDNNILARYEYVNANDDKEKADNASGISKNNNS